MHLCQALRDVREAAGLTQSTVSERTGMGVSSLSELENGKYETKVARVFVEAAAAPTK